MAVDIPAEDKHRSRRSRDRFTHHTKMIGAIDQQTKTISMPNAVAIAVRLKKRFGFERIRRARTERDVGWIVPMKPGFIKRLLQTSYQLNAAQNPAPTVQEMIHLSVPVLYRSHLIH
ncbi:hypothetical protein [Caballeronia mineralivorans]|uniref:hypothetical protein n=1 Tax=Caballeronia mineralivorans TaxID=2010198 RepID=UPI001364A476|nr:hypothetical protein [Caballeronia mineralivorans]